MPGPFDYTVGVPSVAPALEQITGALKERKQRNVLSEIGGMVGQGDYRGAAQTALNRGELDVGMSLADMDAKQKRAFGETVGKYALLADTPQKWDAMRRKLTEMTGQDPGDFETGRLELLAESADIDSIIGMGDKAADNARADEQLSIAQETLRLRQEEANRPNVSPNYQLNPDNTAAPIPGSAADPEIIRRQAEAREAAKPAPRMTASDRKIINDAEDQNLALEGTIEGLSRALEINDKAFTGKGAGMRATIGGKMPDIMVPDFIADPKGANATLEWQNIMSPQAMKAMSDTLTGVTTDFELRKFEEIFSDPSTPRNIREGAMRRLLQLTERQRELNNERIQALSGGDLIAGPGDAEATLQSARDAIDRGADPAAVQQRLIEAGIDPAGLGF